MDSVSVSPAYANGYGEAGVSDGRVCARFLFQRIKFSSCGGVPEGGGGGHRNNGF